MSEISFASTSKSISRPAFVVDPHSIMRDTGRQIDWSALADPQKYKYGSAAVTLNGAVSIDDTDATVDALTKAIPAGTLLYFGEAKEYLRVTADAAVGDTSIDVQASPAAIEDNDVAYYGGDGGNYIKAGTVMDLLANGKIVPAAEGSAGVTAYGLLLTDADEDSKVDSATGYGVVTQGQIYDNLLPESASGSLATWKTELLARGGAWMFMTYADNT